MDGEGDNWLELEYRLLLAGLWTLPDEEDEEDDWCNADRTVGSGESSSR